MTKVTAADVAWLTRQLKDSSDAATKLFYLSRFPPRDAAQPEKRQEEEEAEHHHGHKAKVKDEDDPMRLGGPHRVWSLSLLLWAARLIASDERTLWECLGPEMTSAFDAPLHLWNEQRAVKLAHDFLVWREGRRHDADADEGDEHALRAELSHHASVSIKPKGCGRVARAATPPGDTTSPSLLDGRACGCAAVQPMNGADAYSEGSLMCSGVVPAFGELLRVPRHLMLYVGSVVEHCALGRVIARDPRLSSILANEEALLVLAFVYEYFLVGQARSHWTQLLRHCPPAYPTVPAVAGVSMLFELSGMDMVDEVVARREQTATFCETVRPALPLLYEGLRAEVDGGDGVFASPWMGSLAAFEAAFAEDNVSFAKATFDSRAFHLCVDGVDALALVPWADMVNHGNRSDILIRRVEENGGDFVMHVGAALEPADVGRELWMSYGPLQNWELLQYYGFVLEDNEYDQLPFPVAFHGAGDGDGDGDGEEWAVRRQALMTTYALLGVGRCWVGQRGVPCEALRALMRLHMATAEEFPVMEGGGAGPFYRLSRETEVRVVLAMAATADAVLAQFATTLEEDRDWLAELEGGCDGEKAADTEEDAEEEEEDEHAKERLRLCLRVRMGVKAIAQRFHEWCAAERARLEAQQPP